MLAFPAPRCDLEFYKLNGVSQVPLLKQPGLVMLQVKGSSNRKERVPALFFQYPKAKFTVLYSHGNGEDIGLLVDELKAMSVNMKVNMFAYDYVGYSTSRLEGSAPSESGCIRSITAAWDFLTQDMSIAPQNIILYGRSIGSG
jgi:abhydrolase domain-containing protein 17